MFGVRTVEAAVGEFQRMGPMDNQAYVALPESGSGPGELVLHAWWGLTPVFTDFRDQLAAAGSERMSCLIVGRLVSASGCAID